jgi:serine/threonine protein kinase
MATVPDVALPRGYVLNEYRIDSTLGVGGFGLTYLATDSNLDLKVAIKEYLPGELALRGDDHSVSPKSEDTTETFKWGLSRFLDESRTLASFRHPNIVRVMRFFEANQTAYMVMEFVSGQPLNDWAQARQPLGERAVLSIAVPLLDGLEIIHRAGYIHRDIKPGNIFVRDDGSPVLLDFGSARMAGSNSALTAIVSAGYAPLEQYHSHGKQGPWSDLYAFGGVMYWMVTGSKPVDAAARIREDVLPSAVKIGDRAHYSQNLLAAIDWALTPNEEQRPQSVADFRPALSTSQDTVIVYEKPLVATAQRVSVPPPVELDREAVKRIEAELARHMGPIAAVVIKSAAKKAVSMASLAETLAKEIPDDKERAAFLKKFSGDKSTPTGAPSSPTGSRLQPQAPTAASRIDPITLSEAEGALSKYIGAVAKVVVKRAAAKARDARELYLLIADEIEDQNERKAFIRKALSVSGRE